MAVSLTGERLLMTRASLNAADRLFIESLRDEIANTNGAFVYTSTAAGSVPGGFIMSGSTTSGSSTMSSSSFSSSTGGTNSQADMSYNMRDKNNFSIARSDLPFNWSRVFFNDDMVTLVHRDGKVLMLPIAALDPAQLEAINKLKRDLGEMQRNQETTMQNSMNMVSGVFNNIMNQFPRPPSYQSAVGGMFGKNFPFGPNNNPFNALSGWPFGGGASAAAYTD